MVKEETVRTRLRKPRDFYPQTEHKTVEWRAEPPAVIKKRKMKLIMLLHPIPRASLSAASWACVPVDMRAKHFHSTTNVQLDRHLFHVRRFYTLSDLQRNVVEMRCTAACIDFCFTYGTISVRHWLLPSQFSNREKSKRSLFTESYTIHD